jgi:transmembrane sensor
MMSANLPASSRAHVVKEQAARWIRLQDFAELSEADAREFETWLAESHAHRAAYWRLKAAWDETYRLLALRQPNADPQTWAPAWRAPSLLFRMAAAVALIAMLGGGAFYVLKAPRDRIYATAIGGHETVRFADGTEIELNTDTAIRARMNSNERTVWLEKGEAFFKVKHNSAHPFTVVADGRRIVDLGTQFLVRRETGKLKVALFEGRVRVGKTDLMPGEEAIATPNTLSVTHRSIEDLTNEIAWRNGVLVFRGATLADAARAFNRYSVRKLVVRDPSIAGQIVGGTFRTNDVEGFTSVVQELLGLRVAENGNQIVISR